MAFVNALTGHIQAFDVAYTGQFWGWAMAVQVCSATTLPRFGAIVEAEALQHEAHL